MSNWGHSEALNAWRRKRRLTQKEVADALSMTRGGYANYEAGTAPIPDDRLAKLRAMGYESDRPETSGPMLPVTFPMQQMPYIGYIPAGTWAEPSDTEDFMEVEAKYWKKGRYVSRIEGDSCHPALQRDDLCIWEEKLSPPYGKIVIARKKGDHAATVKQLLWDSVTQAPRLKAINPAFEDAEADGWGAVAMLVGVLWFDEDGGEISIYRKDGIRPDQLIKLRG